MGCDHELRVREFLRQEAADVAPVSGIDRHEDVIEDGKGKRISERVFHKREIEAKPHAVLMIGAGWKKTAAVEVNIKMQLGRFRGQFAFECSFIIVVDDAIEVRKVPRVLTLEGVPAFARDSLGVRVPFKADEAAMLDIAQSPQPTDCSKDFASNPEAADPSP